MDAVRRFEVNKLFLLGSTCAWPRVAEMPIREDSLKTGPMEETNAPHGVAKIAGIKHDQGCRHQHARDFICGMPATRNVPLDNFDPEHRNVLPSLFRRFHGAKQTKAPWVTLWGSGKPTREFLFVEDLAEACFSLVDHCSGAEIVNIGIGCEIIIRVAS